MRQFTFAAAVLVLAGLPGAVSSRSMAAVDLTATLDQVGGRVEQFFTHASSGTSSNTKTRGTAASSD
jgi:hypothetical protein